MNKSHYKRLMQHAESCQVEADQTSYQIATMLDEVSLLAAVQSICDFNLFWLAGISPVIVYTKTLEFLLEHKSEFKRKLSIREMIEFDYIISHNTLNNFDEFRRLLRTSRQKSVAIKINLKCNPIKSKRITA